MVDLNRLEKLQELRQSGALSDDEFLVQKERLFASESQPSSQPKIILVLGGIALVVISITLGYLAAQRETEPYSRALANNTPDTDAPDLAVPIEPATDPRAKAAPAAVGFQWAMNSTVIGLNPAFVESKLGVAKKKSANALIFDVEGCQVDYGVEGNKIVSAHSDVSGRCQPVIDGRKVTPSTTFGSVAGTYSKLISDCIFSCGNAADPTIDLYTAGYHANGFIDVIYHGGYSDISSEAMDQWANAIRRQHGVADDDWSNSNFEWFSCVTDAPLDVSKPMRAERVRGVTIGRDINYCL